MRNVLFMFVLAIMGAPSHAASDWVSRVQDHLGKTKKCDVAVYDVFKDQDKRDSSLQQTITDVACITDLIIGKDTIHEASGCSLVWYNVETGLYRNFTEVGPTMATGTACVDGGFDKLLKMDLWQGTTVGKYISSESDMKKPMIVYSNNQKFTAALAKAITASKVDRQKHKAEQKKEEQAALKKRQAEQKKNGRGQKAEKQRGQKSGGTL